MNAPLENPRCPRCGYNLAGHLARIRRERGERVTCPECGSGWSMADLRAAAPPRWFLEHWRPWVGSPVVTFFRSLAPRSFWSGISVDHRVRPLRLLLFAALVFCAGSAVGALLSVTSGGISGTLLLSGVLCGWVGVYWLAPVLAMLMLIWHVPQTLQPRALHILRIGCYSLSTLWIASTAVALLLAALSWDNHEIVAVVPALIVPVAVLWNAMFWWQALSRYLRVPQPGRTWASGALLSGILVSPAFAWAVMTAYRLTHK